jgi:hypothetical protein
MAAFRLRAAFALVAHHVAEVPGAAVDREGMHRRANELPIAVGDVATAPAPCPRNARRRAKGGGRPGSPESSTDPPLRKREETSSPSRSVLDQIFVLCLADGGEWTKDVLLLTRP